MLEPICKPYLKYCRKYKGKVHVKYKRLFCEEMSV